MPLEFHGVEYYGTAPLAGGPTFIGSVVYPAMVWPADKQLDALVDLDVNLFVRLDPPPGLPSGYGAMSVDISTL